MIEAAPEDLELKRRLFAELADACGPETILATNTSSLPVTAIAAETPGPERVVGMHFFNPPALMKLVEVVATADSSERGAGGDDRGRPAHGPHPDPRQGQPRLHRQPPRPPLLAGVAAHARAGRRRRARRSTAPAARRRLPHGPLRADRPDRARRQPQRRPLLLRAGRRARALAPERDPGADGRRRPARAQERPRLLRLRGRGPPPRARPRPRHRGADPRPGRAGEDRPGGASRSSPAWSPRSPTR